MAACFFSFSHGGDAWGRRPCSCGRGICHLECGTVKECLSLCNKCNFYHQDTKTQRMRAVLSLLLQNLCAFVSLW
jgi:hypothetical protein